MSITEFLLVRIAKDEATAEEFLMEFGGVWSPERVLTELEVKRRIVGLHLPTTSHRWCSSCTDINVEPPNNVEPYPCPTLRALASVYVDHPDYREEWR